MMFPDAGFIALGANRFRIAKDSRLFDGHFDGAPILPGIAHIALALHAIGDDRVPAAVRDVRFRAPIFPGDEVEVIFDGSRFEIRSGGKPATTGVLVFP